MDRVASKTVNVLTKFGETLGRRFSTGDDDTYDIEKFEADYEYERRGSAFRRPLDNKSGKNNNSSYKRRDLVYGGARRNSIDNIAASPSPYSSFNNYRQNPMGKQDGFGRAQYGGGVAGPLNYGFQGGYGGMSSATPYGGMSSATPYGAANGNVGYAPDYYIAERRQLELVPAPPPRYIQQNVPVPVPVDRPVPQPYPVEVPRPVPVDRPVPVAVPTPVPVDRPVPYPVAVDRPVPQPYPVEVTRLVPVDRPVPVAVPTPVPVPVAVPVPSPPPSPVMVENTITHTQRWITGTPAMMNQQQQQISGSPVVMNQQQYMSGSPVMMNQQRYLAGSPAMGMNPCASFGNYSYMR